MDFCLPWPIFGYFPRVRRADYHGGFDLDRTASNFLDTAEPSLRDVAPGNRGNLLALRARQRTFRLILVGALAAKPMRRAPDKDNGAGCCCSKFRNLDNIRNRPEPPL